MRWQLITLFNFFTVFSFGQSSVLEVFKDTSGLLGYKSNTGIEIEAVYQDAHEFHNGYAKVRLNDQYGLIDESGAWFIQAENERISHVVDGHYITYKDTVFSVYKLDGTKIYSDYLLDFNLSEYSVFLKDLKTYDQSNFVVRIIERHTEEFFRLGHPDLPLLASKSILENFDTTQWFLNQAVEQ
jgi:hypothetical protein